MTKAHFEELQYLCFIDSAEQARSNANYDKLFKIYAILSIIVDNLSLDEAMIAFKGWLSFHQYMPRKPAKYEIKVWMATDSQNCYVCGHAFRLSQEGYQAHLHSLGYHVVMKMARPFLDKNRCLFWQFLVLAQMMSTGVILILRSLVWWICLHLLHEGHWPSQSTSFFLFHRLLLLQVVPLHLIFFFFEHSHF